MKQLMYKIMLTCKQATFYSSMRSFRKLDFVRRIQLGMHFMACKNCHEFYHNSRTIDEKIVETFQNTSLLSDEELSREKISTFEKSVNQQIEQLKTN